MSALPLGCTGFVWHQCPSLSALQTPLWPKCGGTGDMITVQSDRTQVARKRSTHIIFTSISWDLALDACSALMSSTSSTGFPSELDSLYSQQQTQTITHTHRHITHTTHTHSHTHRPLLHLKRISSSMAFSSCFILALLTMSWFLASSRSGLSSATTLPSSWSSKPLGKGQRTISICSNLVLIHLCTYVAQKRSRIYTHSISIFSSDIRITLFKGGRYCT